MTTTWRQGTDVREREAIMTERREPPRPKPKTIKIDPAGESIVLAAMLVDARQRTRLLRVLPPDRWQLPQHRAAVEALVELDRRKLPYDVAAIRRLFPEGVDANYLEALARERPEVPGEIQAYVDLVRWDAARADVINGPMADFSEAIADPRAEPVKVRVLAKAIAEGFGAWRDEARVQRPEDVHAEMSRELDARVLGRGIYPYGLAAIDLYGDEPMTPPRLIPAAKPGQLTVITGVSGSGKSTLACRLVLGQIRQKRRVLYGAWEMTGAESLELLAVMSLAEQGHKVSRRKLQTGHGEGLPEMVEAVKARALQIAPFIRFVRNPFQRARHNAKERGSNDRHLDIVEHLIEDSAADVFVADLWERCIVDDEPSEVGQALFRQRDMCASHRCHGILLQQQRLKDIEARQDRRPTREGIKGSAAWVEVADTILGTHRPALFKAVPDEVLVVDVLKQRYAPWPLSIEIAWDPDRAFFGEGISVAYDQPAAARGETSERELDAFTGPVKKGRRGS